MAKALLGFTLLVVVAFILLSAGIVPMIDALKTVTISAPTSFEQKLVYDAEIDILLRQVVVDPSYSHAEEEHPDTYEAVRNCFNTKGAYITFQIEPKKRYLRVCLLDMETIGFQIVDIVGRLAKERTCYIKDGIKSLKELFDYASRNRLIRFTKPL